MAFHKVLCLTFLFLILMLVIIFVDYKCDIASYADDGTPHPSDISLNLVLEKLEVQLMVSLHGLKKLHES